MKWWNRSKTGKKPEPPEKDKKQTDQFEVIIRKLNQIMASLQERFDAITAKLEEGKTEILAELEKLRAGGELTEEQEAALQKVEAIATSMADVSPPGAQPTTT